MSERTQFTFYASFRNALSRIKKKADRADAYDAICAYALMGEEPDLDKLPDAVAIAFELIKPTLDASRRKAESGKAGGSRKQTGSKAEANASKRKQTGSEKEKEGENEKEKEGEKEYECTPPTPSRGKTSKPKQPAFVPPTLEEVEAYCKQRRNNVDHKRFHDYFSASDWVDSEGKPVRNWKQKVITWEGNGNRGKEKKPEPGDYSADPMAFYGN